MGKNKGIILTIVLVICAILLAVFFAAMPFIAIDILSDNVQSGVMHVEDYE